MRSVKVLTSEQEPIFARRLEVCRRFFRVEGELQLGFAKSMVAATLQLDACRQEEQTWRSRGSPPRVRSAEETKKRLAVERRTAQLAQDPARAVRELHRSVQGCEWLCDRWHELARSQRVPDSDEPDRLEPLGVEGCCLALDLLGIGPEERRGRTPLDPPDDGIPPAAHQAALISKHIADLEQAIAALIQKRLWLIERYKSDAKSFYRRSLEALLAARATVSASDPVQGPGAASPVDHFPPEGLDHLWGLGA
jgi:hypothetical protein